MKNRKSLIALLLVLALAIGVLSGCSNNEKKAEPTKAPEVTEAPAAEESAEQPAADGFVEQPAEEPVAEEAPAEPAAEEPSGKEEE